MRDVITFMALMKEVSFILYINISKPNLFSKAFKDDPSCIAVTEPNNLSQGKKHIAIKYHHLRSLVQNKVIRICYIDTRKQSDGIFTNPLNR